MRINRNNDRPLIELDQVRFDNLVIRNLRLQHKADKHPINHSHKHNKAYNSSSIRTAYQTTETAEGLDCSKCVKEEHHTVPDIDAWESIRYFEELVLGQVLGNFLGFAEAAERKDQVQDSEQAYTLLAVDVVLDVV